MQDNGATYQVKTEIFEGPMDLLVHLIKKNEVSIYDIPIASITRQFLAYLDLMKFLNIDFAGLLSEYKPDLYFGGDQVLFWGPISWTVIFGLAFATFLTLIIVPVMYRITTILNHKIVDLFGKLRKDTNGNGGTDLSPAAQLEE